MPKLELEMPVGDDGWDALAPKIVRTQMLFADISYVDLATELE